MAVWMSQARDTKECLIAVIPKCASYRWLKFIIIEGPYSFLLISSQAQPMEALLPDGNSKLPPRAFAAALLEKSRDTSPDVPPPPAARVTSAGTAGQRRRCRLRGFHGMGALGCAKMMLG